MPIVAADIVAYGSASMPDTDTPTGIGGAIDLTVRVVFTDIVATDQIEILSSDVGDTTQTITVHGRNAAGELVNDVQTLNGTTVALIAGVFERVLKIIKSATTTGTVTIRDQDTDATIATMEPAVLEIRRPFYDAAADASGGSARTYYEKIFFKNNHGSLTLTAAEIKEFADPSTNVDFDLDDPGSPIGVWWAPDELASAASALGFLAQVVHMPERFYGAAYRFDLVLSRP